MSGNNSKKKKGSHKKDHNNNNNYGSSTPTKPIATRNNTLSLFNSLSPSSSSSTSIVASPATRPNFQNEVLADLQVTDFEPAQFIENVVNKAKSSRESFDQFQRAFASNGVSFTLKSDAFFSSGDVDENGKKALETAVWSYLEKILEENQDENAKAVLREIESERANAVLNVADAANASSSTTSASSTTTAHATTTTNATTTTATAALELKENQKVDSEEEKTPDLEFAEFVYGGINGDIFTIQSLVDCLLNEEHNRDDNSFEKFKKALTALGITFDKGKDLFFESNSNTPKRDVKPLDLIALEFAVGNAVEKVLTHKKFEKDRPENSKVESVLQEIMAIKEARTNTTAKAISSSVRALVDKGATLIQSLGRGYLARKQLKVVKRTAELERREEQYRRDISYASPVKKTKLSSQTVNESTTSRRLFSDLIPSNPTWDDFSRLFRDFLSKKVLEEDIQLSKIMVLTKTDDEFRNFTFNRAPNLYKEKDSYKVNGELMVASYVEKVYKRFLDDIFEFLKNTKPAEHQSKCKNTFEGFRAALRSYFLKEALQKGDKLFAIGAGIGAAITQANNIDKLAPELKAILSAQKTDNVYFANINNVLALAKEVYDQFLDDKAEDYKSYLVAIATTEEGYQESLEKLETNKVKLFSGNKDLVSGVISDANTSTSDDFRVVVGFMANLGADVMKAALKQQAEEFNKAKDAQVRKLEEEKALLEAQLQQQGENSNANSNLNNNNSNKNSKPNDNASGVSERWKKVKDNLSTSNENRTIELATQAGIISSDLAQKMRGVQATLSKKDPKDASSLQDSDLHDLEQGQAKVQVAQQILNLYKDVAQAPAVLEKLVKEEELKQKGFSASQAANWMW